MALSQQINKWARFLLGSIVFIVFAGLASYYVIAKYQTVVAEKKDKATMIARHLETCIDGRLIALELLVTDPDIRGTDRTEAAVELGRAAKMLDFFNIAIFDHGGRIIAESAHTPTVRPLQDRGSFQSAWSGLPVVSERILEDKLSSGYVSLRVPVRDEQGHVKAVLAADLPLHEISRVINAHDFSKGEYVFVIDTNARLLHHPRFAELFDRENDLLAYQKLFLDSSQQAFFAVSQPDMVETLYVSDSIGQTGWRVIVATPVYDIYNTIIRGSLGDLGIFLLLILLIGLLCYILFQTRRHELEMENLKFERLASASQMAAGIAHEIRNPLTSIKGFIQLIMHKKDQPPPEGYLDIIYNEIERIEKLIYEFQMLARPLKQAYFKQIDVAKIVSDVSMLMQGQALEKKASLTFDGHFPAPSVYQVMGDEAQLKQVLINLIRNAIEAVDSGGKIDLSLSLKEKMVAITVSDNGIGIPQDVLVKLGTPFYTTKASGTGLGLSVCYSIVQAHNGQLEVVSKVGEGTSFTLKLPCVMNA